MRTMFLIIVGIGIILAGSSTVIFLQQTEMECLRLYKDMRELSRTPEMSLADQQTIDAHKNLVFEYVEKNCPDFPDLGFIYDNYNQNSLEVEPIFDSEIYFDYEIESDGVTYGSQYQISGGIVNEITYAKNSNSLIVSLSESEKGFIQILIQTGLLHSIDQSPFTYFVIADGEEIEFEKLSPILLKIPFEKGTGQIEIIGTSW